MFVACSTQCFAKYPLDRALRTIGELEFGKVDVAIHEKGPHLRPSQVVADVHAAAHQIRIGPSLTPGAFSVEIEATDPDEYDRQLRAICRLARLSSVAIITIAAAPVGTPLEEEVARLTRLVRLATEESVVLTVETRIGTLTEDPDVAVTLCKRVEGLGLTLDPSHYIAGPHQGRPFDQVLPYVRHVHLRDTALNAFQVRVGQGVIEYGRLITHLARHDYDRLLTVEITNGQEFPYPVDQEVRKLKYLLESLI